MSAPIPTDPAQLAALRARQRRTLLILAVALMAGGILILFVLKKVPPPLRILIGLSDFFTGLILLVVVRQKFGKAGSPS